MDFLKNFPWSLQERFRSGRLLFGSFFFIYVKDDQKDKKRDQDDRYIVHIPEEPAAVSPPVKQIVPHVSEHQPSNH